VNVCQRWRYVVFASPRRLDLKLHCIPKTPVRKTLDVWPALPIVVLSHGILRSLVEGADDIIAALENSDRGYSIDLWTVSNSLLERFAVVLRGPFPELSYLELSSGDEAMKRHQPFPIRSWEDMSHGLQLLGFNRVSFPASPKLLCSTGHLVRLHLQTIPNSGYISLELMVTCLSALAKLEELKLGLGSLVSSSEAITDVRRKSWP
jgi:hypothetical protein